MTLAALAPSWLLLLLALVLIAAAVQDAVSMRITNTLSSAVILLALTAMALHGFAFPMWQNGALFFALLLVGTGVFATGNLGGGDVKLLAAIGLWFKLADAFWLLIAIAIAGGLLALVMIVGRRLIASAGGKRPSRGFIPYGVAIVAGSAFVLGIEIHDRVGRQEQLTSAPRLALAQIRAPANSVP